MALHQTNLPDLSDMIVGILGGTGDQGRGLGYRLARSGQSVIIGSRTAERGLTAASQLAALPGVTGTVTGGDNQQTAERADVVIVATPWAGHAETLAALVGPLTGKIVIDCVNPLGFDERGPYALPVAEGSATEQAAVLLPHSRVCGAFHHVSAQLLADPTLDQVAAQDVLVLGEDKSAVAVVQALAAQIPQLRGVHAGRLRNAAQVEALTANLLVINRRYRVHSGLRLAGL